MRQLEYLLQNNRAWAQEVSERDPGFFERRASQQAHKLSATSSLLLMARRTLPHERRSAPLHLKTSGGQEYET